jgi:hypothetical protein
MFNFCNNLNQNITIPNSVTDCSDMFYLCKNLNQNILVPNSVTDCSEMFAYCYILNQDMYIYSENIVNMQKMFAGCANMVGKQIHIRSSIPRAASNVIYNSLINNYTGVNFDGNVLNDLEEPTEWPPV